MSRIHRTSASAFILPTSRFLVLCFWRPRWWLFAKMAPDTRPKWRAMPFLILRAKYLHSGQCGRTGAVRCQVEIIVVRVSVMTRVATWRHDRTCKLFFVQPLPIEVAYTCVLLCFIKPILGKHYVRSWGFIVSEPSEVHPDLRRPNLSLSPLVCPILTLHLVAPGICLPVSVSLEQAWWPISYFHFHRQPVPPKDGLIALWQSTNG